MTLKHLLATFSLAGACQLANAGVILDQQYWALGTAAGNLSNGSTFGRAQTFTVAVGGLLDSIDAQASTGTFTAARILATSGGAPIGGSGGSVVLATSSSVRSEGDVFTFDFSSSALAVSAGDVLALELFGSSIVQWVGGRIPGYAGGSDYFFNTRFGRPGWSRGELDWNFRSYVDVPGPTPLALLGLGLACLGLVRLGKDGATKSCKD